MRSWLALAMIFGCWVPLLSAEAKPKTVFIVPVKDDVMPPLVYLVRRGVKAAMEEEADLLVLDMKTNGGRLDSAEEIMNIIGQFKGQTVTYVDDRALSAGMFIAVATKSIYMAPQSVIGAAAPILLGPGGGLEKAPETFEVKMTSAVRALVRREAEKNGYNTAVVEAMIDKHKGLVIDGQVISHEGDILTLTDSEARKMYGHPPKPLISSGTVESLDSLIKTLGYGGARQVLIQPTGVEQLASWINKISPLFLILGVLGIYLELKTPGFGLPGIVGVVAFALYFFGTYVAGLSGLEWVALFLIGLVLLGLEFFLFPGTVVLGLSGFVLMLVALVMAMADVYPGGPMLPSIGQLRLPLHNFAIAFFGASIGIWLLSRLFPKTSIYHRLVSESASGESSVLQRRQEQAERLGEVGLAISNLRPSGKAKFGDEILDVITQGDLISKETPVRIVGYSNGVPMVEEIKS